MVNVPDIISNCPPNSRNSVASEPEVIFQTTSQQSEKPQQEVIIELVEPNSSRVPSQSSNSREAEETSASPTLEVAVSSLKRTENGNSEDVRIDNSCCTRITSFLCRFQEPQKLANNIQLDAKVSNAKTGDIKRKRRHEKTKNGAKKQNDLESTFEANLFNRFSMPDRHNVDGLLEKTSETDSLRKSMQKVRKRNEDDAIALKLSVKPRSLRKKRTFDHESDREENSLIISIWNFAITGSILYNVIFVILRFSFSKVDEKYRGIWTFLDIFADIAYLVDILFNMRTSFLYEGLVISEPGLVRWNYLNKVAFKLDVVSALPLDLIFRGLYYLHKKELWPDKISTSKVSFPNRAYVAMRISSKNQFLTQKLRVPITPAPVPS